MTRREASYVYDDAMHRMVERQVYRDQPLRLWRRRIIYWGFPIVTIGFFAFAAYLQRLGEKQDAEFFWIGGGIFVVYTVTVHAVRFHRRSRMIRGRRAGGMRTVKQTIVLSDAGVRSDMKEFGSSDIAWVSFCRATCSERMLLLYMSRIDYVAFPREGRSDADWSLLCGEVQEKIGVKKC